jgi:hypothetical protein
MLRRYTEDRLSKNTRCVSGLEASNRVSPRRAIACANLFGLVCRERRGSSDVDAGREDAGDVAGWAQSLAQLKELETKVGVFT